jgi:hypothetical protein
MRPWIVIGLMMAIAGGAEAQNPGKTGEEKKDEKATASLAKKIDKADIVVVGKVSQVGLSAASSFDVGVIEVREVLKGKAKIKTVKFRFQSSGNGTVAPYGKKGVDGVWMLGKEGAYLAAREVLSYQPLGELKAIKKILSKTQKQGKRPKVDKK